MNQIVEFFLHLNRHLNEAADQMGPWLYVLLFAIIFAETGLVVTPFLPGDSLLFLVGALAASPKSPIDLWLVALILWIAAVLGDAVNYAIGHKIGSKVFSNDKSRFFKRERLDRTQRFYEKYGGKTIILARFVPIVRTFAPFVAGIGRMRYTRFVIFNVVGGLAWVLSFLLAGYQFGYLIPEDKFFWVEIGIVAISLVPIGIEVLKARSEARRTADAARAASPLPTEPPIVPQP